MYNKPEECRLQDGTMMKDKIWGGEPTFMSGAKVMLFTGPLNILLLCAPIAIISWIANLSDAATFIFSLLAIAPLA